VEIAHIGLIRVCRRDSGPDIALTPTRTAERSSDDVVVWWKIRRVLSLPAECVDVLALLSL